MHAMLPDNGAPLTRLPLRRVAERCHQESTLYLERGPHDPRFCYELWRRAIVDRDQRAWDAVYRQYAELTPVVRHWVERHSMFSATGEDAAYFVNRAFERLWQALDAQKFTRFPDLPALLRYLKLCVHSSITDHVRGARDEDELPEDERHDIAAPAATRDDGGDLWELVAARLDGGQEQTAVYARYVLAMKPQEIYEAYPGLYASVKQVYAVLQNALRRLRRDDELLRYLAERA
jgi:hypothetical protein